MSGAAMMHAAAVVEALAPRHVARIKQLVRQEFYDGAPFFIVIPDLVAQTGDPTGTGDGGSGRTLAAEFSDTKHVRGTCSMARSMDPNSANSQFFIMFERVGSLDGKYTVFGRVVDGMEHINKIKRGNDAANGAVQNPDRMIKVRVGE